MKRPCCAAGTRLGITPREASQGRTTCPVCRHPLTVTANPLALARVLKGLGSYVVVIVPPHEALKRDE